MKKNLLVLFVILPILFFSFKAVRASDWPEWAPEPELFSPTSETVDLTGKATLEFKWSPFIGKLWERIYYDFRLYKGRDKMEGSQILVQKVAPAVYSVILDAAMFEDGQVYTWGVRQFYVDKRSDQAYSSFTVIKK